MLVVQLKAQPGADCAQAVFVFSNFCFKYEIKVAFSLRNTLDEVE